MQVALGLGLLLRECKQVIKYEEDEVTLETPTYVGASILNIKMLDLVIEAVEKSKDVQQEPAILDKAAHKDGLETKDSADEEEAVVEVKGKKAMKSGGSGKPSKKAKDTGQLVEIWPALVLQISYLPFEIWPAHALQLWLVSFHQPASSHVRSGQHRLYISGCYLSFEIWPALALHVWHIWYSSVLG
ncbi:hypothetical protein BDR07DRAFT_1386360 [Suillus spraguei]|nr:hypothetical protein BDR07DRAFT_1386360 [Suillus spraguei]